jgi:hypothetical protein
MVGPGLAQWWSAFFLAGLGTAFGVLGAAALPLLVFHSPLSAWFDQIARIFGLCLLLSSLLTFLALHTGKRWLRQLINLSNTCIMLWLGAFFLVADPVSSVLLWVSFACAALYGLLYVQGKYRLGE